MALVTLLRAMVFVRTSFTEETDDDLDLSTADLTRIKGNAMQ